MPKPNRRKRIGVHLFWGRYSFRKAFSFVIVPFPFLLVVPLFLFILFVVVFFFGNSSKKSIGCYDSISRNSIRRIYSVHAPWYALISREVVRPMLDSDSCGRISYRSVTSTTGQWKPALRLSVRITPSSSFAVQRDFAIVASVSVSGT